MIPAEQRKKLEQMAKTQLTKKIVMDNPCNDYFTAMYMAGAEAAWELATQVERERCVSIIKKMNDDLPNTSAAIMR